VFAEGLIVVASGRAPERPIFAIRPGGQGDITPADNADSSAHVAWRKTGRGSYMPTPLIYKDVVYVLGNAGLLDAYDLRTGREIYRQRLEHRGSGFSASPVAADTRIYLSSEDGDMFVVQTGAEFKLLAKNPMGEPLMATPAIAGSTMYVRGERQLFAVGRQAANSDRQDGR
jgi:outer membrane protein assembly factor BamB